jgi:hypothetical protein
MNIIQKSVKLFFMPLYHPILDTIDNLEQIIKNELVKSIKIHGISTFCGPENVSKDFITLIKKYSMPLQIHADLYNKNEISPLHKAYNLNHPKKWINLALNNDIKIVITHGSRLDEESINLAKDNKNIMFTLSPDLLLSSENERMAKTFSNYINTALKLISPNQILFDIDYGWNISKRTNSDNHDWNMKYRLMDSLALLNFSKKEINSIFFDNANSFFNLHF